MQFKSLEDKCLYYRGLGDYKLLPNSYVMVMLDGRSFSHMVKNKFEKPFSDDFIEMMNETAKYVCKNVQGAKLAYVQSDEISIVLTDFDTPTTDAFFGNRLSKLCSIIASLATAKFNQLMTSYHFDKTWDEGYAPDLSVDDICNKIEELPLYQFDCKCWNVPTYNDVFAWFLYRNIDCTKNSKQQTAQTYVPHKELVGKTTDVQIEYLKEKKNIDWNNFTPNKKWGRFIWKVEKPFKTLEGDTYVRHIWEVFDGMDLTTEEGREFFHSINVIPHK
jgi:tRNA(His) 5'-end guanylyltransferase